jgi:Outer membrane protein beta-barrel domain
MYRTPTVLLFATVLTAWIAHAQYEVPRFNFNIGGGIGFPLSSTSDFVNEGANFVIGAGPNFARAFGMNAEFMWHDLPVKRGVINELRVPDASARVYSVTINGILRVPTHGHLGIYGIGGGGWYHRSGEATAPALVPGTVCPSFWVWWGECVNGLWPGNVVLGSSSSDAVGGNIGAGLTLGLGEGSLKFYTELRYHHASHNKVSTDILPLTFGLRW